MAAIYNTDIVSEDLTFNVDVGNPKSWSPNVHPYPTDLYSWVTSGQNSTLIRDTSQTSPVGSTPLKMTVTGVDPFTISYNTTGYNLAAASIGQTWTVSVWARANTTTTGSIFIFGANSAGTYIEAPSSNFTITTTWTRFSFTHTFVNASTVAIQTRLDGPDSGTVVDIWWDGLQVEQSSSVTPFNPKSNPTRAWYDLGPNKIDLSPTGTINATTLGGAYCFGFNNSMYWTSTIAAAQTTDYRYGSTIELWLYNQTKPERRTVFQKNGNTYASYEQEVAMTWEVANDISGYRAYNAYDFSSSGPLNNNAWNHCVLVLNPYLGTGQWYLNGVASGSYTQRATQWPPQAGEIVIGNGYAGIVQTGGVAVVRTYRSMFTADQVMQNYNANKTRFGL